MPEPTERAQPTGPTPDQVADAVQQTPELQKDHTTPSIAGELPNAAQEQAAIKARQSHASHLDGNGIQAPPITPTFNGAAPPTDPPKLTPIFNAAAQPPKPPPPPAPQLNLDPPQPSGPGGGAGGQVSPALSDNDPIEDFKKKMLVRHEFNRRARGLGRGNPGDRDR